LRRRTTFGGMAHALNKLPRPPRAVAEEILGSLGVLAKAEPHAVRAALELTIEKGDAAFASYAEIVEKVVNDLVGLLASGAQIDLDPLIESLLEEERSAARSKRESERRASVDLRRLAKSTPDKLAVINEVLQNALARADRVAAMCRDARWRLMEARSYYQPGKPVGPMRGEPWDADEYLKTLG
jgi:hypothetical protein